MKSRLVAILFILFAVSSCIKMDDFEFGQITKDNFRMMGLTHATSCPTIEITNKTKRTITLKELDVTCHIAGKSLAFLKLKEDVKIPKNAIKQIVKFPLFFRIELNNYSPLRFLSSPEEIKSFEFDINLKVKAGLFIKKYKFKSLTYLQLCEIIGYNSQFLL